MRVSVVIPTYNAGDEITRLLHALHAQQPAPPHEIIAIDSGSRDDTCERVRAAGGRVVELREKFNHGLTRDAGIRATTGDVVVLTVQDAVPVGADWLARLVRHFDDPAVAGVSGLQIPPPDGPLELRIKVALDLQGPEVLRLSLADHPSYAQYTPAQRLELYRFDDVCAALRRSAWEKLPYGACRYAEDYQWARRALEAGHTLVRDNRAQVVHAHRRTFRYEFRRGLLDAWVLHEAFGYRYRLLDKLNRARLLAGPRKVAVKPLGDRPTVAARLGALKTYSAHVLARSLYSGYCWTLRPLGLGRGCLDWATRGI